MDLEIIIINPLEDIDTEKAGGEDLFKDLLLGIGQKEGISAKEARHLLIEPHELPTERKIYKPKDIKKAGIHFYPFDKITDIKDKIYLLTGIPIYRQHIAVPYDGKTSLSLYNIFTDHNILVDGLKMKEANKWYLGLPIDEDLYEAKDFIRVEEHEYFTLMKDINTINVLYVIDLKLLISKIQTQLIELLNDTYRFELIYYGFILKYFPIMTKEVFIDYITNESELCNKYPSLAPRFDSLRVKYDFEADIINQLPGIIETPKLTKDIHTDVYGIVIETNLHTPIDTRALYDMLHANNPNNPIIQLYITYEGENYLFVKTNKLAQHKEYQFPLGSLMKDGVVILQITDRANMFINFKENGKLLIKLEYIDGSNVDDILNFVIDETRQIIDWLNGMRFHFMHIPLILPYLSKNNITVKSINNALIWKRAIDDFMFKQLGGAMLNLEKAGIVALKTAKPVGGQIELVFKKGITHFDETIIDKAIVAMTGTRLSNHYMYLSDKLVREKWEQIYAGKTVNIIHRQGDILFDIQDVNEQEDVIIRNIFIKFVEEFDEIYIKRKIKRSPFVPMPQEQKRVEAKKEVKKLRKLKEEDPQLFRFKTEKSAAVYSKLCQNKHQPIVYKESELTEELRAKAVKYKNITYGYPLYYVCPNPEFPNLSFITGMHPQNYCLPCCNKRAKMNERKKKIYEKCLKDFCYIDDTTAEGNLHILLYNKELDVGRFSVLPKQLSDLFLTGEYSNYFIYGVDQEPVGILSAVIDALSDHEDFAHKTIDDITEDLTTAYTEEVHARILNGQLAQHLNIGREDIIEILRNKTEYTLIPKLNEFLLELIYIVYGKVVILFIDEYGDGENITLFLTNIAKYNIMAETNAEYIWLIKKRNYFYPIYVYEDGVIKNRRYENVELFNKMVKLNDKKQIDQTIDIDTITTFCEDMEYSIKKVYMNLSNICYAVLIEISSKEYVYIPVNYAIATKGELEYELWDEKKYPVLRKNTERVIKELSAYIELGETEDVFYVKGNKKYTYGVKTLKHFIFYHNEIPAPYKLDGINDFINQINYLDVNRKILARAPEIENPRNTRLGNAGYNIFKYNMLVSQFIKDISYERNMELREKIYKIFTSSKGQKKADIHKFYNIVNEFDSSIANADTAILSKIINSYNEYMPKAVLAIVEQYAFNFDVITLKQIRATHTMDKHSERVKIIKSIITPIINEITLNLKLPQTPSFSSKLNCYDIDSPFIKYCKDARLLFEKKELPRYIDILATDLSNIKTYTYTVNLSHSILLYFFHVNTTREEFNVIYKLV